MAAVLVGRGHEGDVVSIVLERSPRRLPRDMAASESCGTDRLSRRHRGCPKRSELSA